MKAKTRPHSRPFSKATGRSRWPALAAHVNPIGNVRIAAVTAPGTCPIVVIGSGMAGYALIRRLREYRPDRAICLITADSGDVYSKPLLSNALAQRQIPSGLVQKSGIRLCAELNVELMAFCEAHEIDSGLRVVSTSSGKIAYGQLVLATGAHQRIILPSGAKPEWVHTVNSLHDYRHWYACLAGARRALIIGCGLIGCEFADDLMSHGMQVELVDPAPWPLSRLLPEQIGARLAEELARRGARLHMGTSVERLDKRGATFYATLGDGSTVETDLVLCATGLHPETALARSAKLEVARGVLVNRQLQTSDPDIHALGDCAETEAGLLPYVLPLMAQARCLAQILGGNEAVLTLDAMPVVVKTTSLRLVVCPPRHGVTGQWVVSGSGVDLTAIFQNHEGTALGFALSGTAIRRKRELEKLMPPLIAATPATAA